MNTIQSYGSINLNKNYNKQYTNFKSNRNFKTLNGILQSKLNERLFPLYAKMLRPAILKVEPAKSYEELHKILKSSIRFYKFTDFIDNLTYSLLFPKKMRTSKYDAKEVIDMGYAFAQEHKDNLATLTNAVVRSRNTDYLKGILKALEEWKTVE